MKINKKFIFDFDEFELSNYFFDQVQKLQSKGFVVKSLVLNPETIRLLMDKYFKSLSGSYRIPKGSFEDVVFMHTLGDPKMEKDEFRLVIEPIEDKE